jgi:hypothetical protein
MARVMQAPSRRKVPDAVSPWDPLFWLALLLVITEWRNGFGRTPSTGHRGTHTRWSVIPRSHSQWFARESIVIIHRFSCTHIINLHFFVCFHTRRKLLIIHHHPSTLLPASYLRFIHRLISRYL